MQVQSGTRLGPYEIVSRLGAGGMGEVWRASDTRLDRHVAVKILPEEFARNPQLLIRFEREARTISQLTHPHICTLFDVGQVDGVNYLVMELLEGESLADRIARGPLPLPDVLRYGREIADALARAHRQGVVHRDLKPGNVMLTKSGAKLLDFGLSKSLPTSATVHDATEHKPLTQEGTVLGTYQYMAPEQVAGDEADHRSDIFALGVVLYEMATGQRAFSGATRTSLIASIVGAEPRPLRELQPLTPPVFEHLLAKCLEKDPERRWQSAHDIAEELRWIHDAGSQAGAPVQIAVRKRSRERIAWGLAALLALAVAAGAPMVLNLSRAARAPHVLDVAPPHGHRFKAMGDDSGPAVISPDGTRVVYSVSDGRSNHLEVRSLRTGEVQVLNGTGDASYPFWSPDSKRVAFFSFNALKIASLDGGAPVTVAAVNAARGGAWSPDGTIIFTPTTLDPLNAVSSEGGATRPLTRLDSAQHTTHRWPFFLPDGKRFLFLAANHQDPNGSSNAIFLGSTEGGQPRMILRSVSSAVFHDGRLFFTRADQLFAQKVDGDFNPSGDPVPIADKVFYDNGVWRSSATIADDGTLLFHASVPVSRATNLSWFDRSGKLLSQVADGGPFFDLELSPDQQKLAVVVGDPDREIWVYDFPRNARTTVSLGSPSIGNVIWAPDGQSLYVDARNGASYEILAKRISGGGERRILSTSSQIAIADVSPDGKTILMEDGSRLYTAPADGSAAKAQPLNVNATGLLASFSPDGRWITYESLENGRRDVFITSARDDSIRWQISPAGGTAARWRADGKELYFIDANQLLTAVTIQEKGDDVQLGNPQTLFPVRIPPNVHAYEAGADGTRFLVNTTTEHPSPTIVVFKRWDQRLRK